MPKFLYKDWVGTDERRKGTTSGVKETKSLGRRKRIFT